MSELKDLLYCTGYTKTVQSSAEARDLLRYAYQFRAKLNEAIKREEHSVSMRADTPHEIKAMLATLSDVNR